MMPPRPTALAQMLLKDVIHRGDTVIDATAGNGHDTVFLAECVGPEGRVLAFDIQAAAIKSATDRVAAAGLGDRVEFFHDSHTAMAGHADPNSVAAVMFNLGYLPGAERQLITTAAETTGALRAAAIILRPGGLISVVCYPGHDGGADEARAVEQWMIDSGWRVAKYKTLGTREPAPFLLVASKPIKA